MNTQPSNQPNDNHQERAYQAYGAVTRFGTCPVCGLERPLAADGTMIGHDRTETTESGDVRTTCPGTGQEPRP
jgi:hypothetical protein